MKDTTALPRLCREIADVKLGWGNSQQWSNADFDALSEQIHAETGVSLSTSTLKRLWGRVRYTGTPQAATLNTLARFAGYNSFRAFTDVSHPPQPGIPTPDPPAPTAPKTEPPTGVGTALSKRSLSRSGLWAVGLCTGLFLSLLIAFSLNRPEKKYTATPDQFTFSSRPVTTGVPNSVVFTFDVSHAKTDCLAIQQSWDAKHRFAITKDQHQATSIYYRPGFFRAKLLVGGRVVEEHDLLIRTTGWLALIEQEPVPVYLPNDQVVSDTVIRVSLPTIRKSRIALQPQPPQLGYYNAGNFAPVSTSDFDFVTQVKNEYREGAAVCQRVSVGLLTEGSPILIPLSAKGCVSELSLLSVDQYLSGKETDLSAFGVDFSGWVTVRCRGNAQHVRFYVDGRLAREVPAPAQPTRIVGIVYAFEGTGAVRGITLRTSGQPVFQAFASPPSPHPGRLTKTAHF